MEWTKLLLVDFLVPLLSAFAWPSVALAAMWIFRETLRDAARRVTHLKGGPVEAKFNTIEPPPQVKETLIIENAEPSPTVDRISHPDSRLLPPAPKL